MTTMQKTYRNGTVANISKSFILCGATKEQSDIALKIFKAITMVDEAE